MCDAPCAPPPADRRLCRSFVPEPPEPAVAPEPASAAVGTAASEEKQAVADRMARMHFALASAIAPAAEGMPGEGRATAGQEQEAGQEQAAAGQEEATGAAGGGLAAGWEQLSDEDGTPYYHNLQSGDVVWQFPRG